MSYASQVYLNYIWKGKNEELCKNLYGSTPITMGDVSELAKQILGAYKEKEWHNDERKSGLTRSLVEINRELACLTPKTRENIESLHKGVIEAAHQSVAMGGPCYVLNKAATAWSLSLMARDNDVELTPFYFVADYDEVQSELTNMRTPLMGSDGNLISVPVPQGYEHSPVSVLPLPRQDWYREIEESIRSNYHPMFKMMSGPVRNLFEERLEGTLAIIRWAYHNSETLGDWALRILGRLLNIESNLGMPLMPASDKRIRELMTPGMEILLSRSNREKFLEGHERATQLIIDSGFDPGMGHRDRYFVPFFYECQEKDCHKSRVELSYIDEGSRLRLSGKCPSCGQTIDLETSPEDPDLTDIAAYLSPRVDTRQIIVDTVLPIATHIGGAGETAYYAQVIPAARDMSLPFPVFVKYPRVYFNTPWNENLSNTLKDKGFRTLHEPAMFKLLGKVNKHKRKSNPEEMNSALADLQSLIYEVHSALNDGLEEFDEKIDSASGDKLDEMHHTRLEVERYLSWVFGQYADEKLGQESSWSWIEWVLNSGLTDIFGPYSRAYVPEMKNGATVFVNFFF